MSRYDHAAGPNLVVFSSLFPSSSQPQAGLFIRERMFKVAETLPMLVVSPTPWFPLQRLIRLVRPQYRPSVPYHEVQQGIDVYHPWFFAMPGVLRRLDGWFMALGAWNTLRRLKAKRGINLIDAHFAYPDGYAASLLGRWLDLPFVVTLRGTEVRMCESPALRRRIVAALDDAARVVTVANSLKQVVVDAGADPQKITRVGNGVDSERFQPIPKDLARERLGLDEQEKVIVSVGGLVPRKGFQRVIKVLPDLLRQHPGLKYLIVGGAGPEGDFEQQLRKLVDEKALGDAVVFLGPMAPDDLKVPLSAADVFVLATANEGWANVFLEAMACGLPVVTTRVGGNAEVVTEDQLGVLVEFGNSAALSAALSSALTKRWDRAYIRRHAVGNDWSTRVSALRETFQQVVALAKR